MSLGSLLDGLHRRVPQNMMQAGCGDFQIAGGTSDVSRQGFGSGRERSIPNLDASDGSVLSTLNPIEGNGFAVF